MMLPLGNETNWEHAERLRIELSLRCPRCGATNRMHAIVITLARHLEATCGICKHRWDTCAVPPPELRLVHD